MQMLILLHYLLYAVSEYSEFWLMWGMTLHNLSAKLVFAMKNALIFQNGYLVFMAHVGIFIVHTKLIIKIAFFNVLLLTNAL